MESHQPQGHSGRMIHVRSRTRSTIPLRTIAYSYDGQGNSQRKTLGGSDHELQHRDEPSLIRRLLRGALAGLIATAPMSLTMITLHQYLPRHQRYPLPPHRITHRVMEGHRRDPSHEEKKALTLVSHFTYGAVAGALFSGLVQQPPLRSTLSGLIYGLLVWAGSYFGLLPALQILDARDEETPERNLMMAVTHVVWGITAGWLTGLLNK